MMMFVRVFIPWVTVLLISLFSTLLEAQTRMVKTLSEGWVFHQGPAEGAGEKSFDDSRWKQVEIPHDWAIYGPFDKEIDKQTVRIEQNNEVIASEKTGRTGALPFIGVGWYRNAFEVPILQPGQQVLLTFDGAMSNAEIYVNGQFIGQRAYGYSYFYFDISDYIETGAENILAVRLENLPFSSRWYPGAGIYRKVQLVIKSPSSFEHWGHFITTPFISGEEARIQIKSTVQGKNLNISTRILNGEDREIATNRETICFANEFIQNIRVEDPILWSPDHPYLYTAELNLYEGDVLRDSERIRFGIREIEYDRNRGFVLNGEIMKFKGVCLHHDLGPLGIAINRSALRRQLTILKDMGCNAIRSAHNMPSLEQLELCDEMGFLFIAESFDEWKRPKVKNGYNLYFDEWVEKDIQNLVKATRNHPCIVMWSAGNEVPDQWGAEGVKRAKWIQDMFHAEDPTRPVTVGMDQVENTMKSGFGALLDIPGLNYRVHLYEEAFEKFPQGLILGSETASTVSSRGIYKFPVEEFSMKTYEDLQSSSYDLERCSWSNIPEIDFQMQDDKPWVIGEFVWTGFDYLGEPTPYDNFWPSRSSYFGICDLAGIPKDRYYLYRSRWNTEENTLHILPHWNWTGREGEQTPVFVYTNHPSAELFVNGRSQGIRTKQDSSLLARYRLRWMDVVYEPGEVKVIAYDHAGNTVQEKRIHTAGEPDHLLLEADRTLLNADGQDLSFITVTIVDKVGHPCPNAANSLNFMVEGSGTFRAVCNGDPTSLELFHEPRMKAFSGKLVAIVQAGTKSGDIMLKVEGEGLKTAQIKLSAQ